MGGDALRNLFVGLTKGRIVVFVQRVYFIQPYPISPTCSYVIIYEAIIVIPPAYFK
jgi:hypothetical protein